MSSWTVEQVRAIAPSARAFATAEPLAIESRWSGTGADEVALWGAHLGSGAEPYDVMVDHVHLKWRCSCPSRQHPCKHALALLLLWVRGGVPQAAAPTAVERWVARHETTETPTSSGRDDQSARNDDQSADEPGSLDTDPPGEPDRDDLDRARDQRVARLVDGLRELERWLDDRMRTGLADPALARYETWDHLAARLVDARAGALANRVRRLAGLVGSGPDWQSDVLTELGMLHLIALGGQRVPALPGDLADAVATASGWQVRQTEVLAGAPIADDWFVAGRSDTREDRIEVRRLWLYGVNSGRWAMLLSFAAYQQTLDSSWQVGSIVTADLHFYPGGSMRALAGERGRDPLPLHSPATPLPALASTSSVADVCVFVGGRVAGEPWLERLGAFVLAAPTIVEGRWVLADGTGALPIAPEAISNGGSLATVVAACADRPRPLTIEWTPRGVIPLAVHLPDRALDVGPVADASFVTT